MKISKMKKILMALSIGVILPMTNLSAAGNEPASLDADTVTYDMSTGEATATGNVLLTRGTAKATGAKATYNTKTMAATIEGDVIAVRDDTRVTCAKMISDGTEHMQAIGNVYGIQKDKTFRGELVD
ncbi:MAG: organic solvent tolerance protein OstA, partial [Selenomonas sp.]|nr:organic solvent tolerance protein OstA [Selenomonas sp.]